ncbi:hypothetical protein [Ulvibacterium marinum]|uniref:hypothetical protein n=1 Tax=Ulvibacterium marinum TaxID=2419782 RepID=UPI001314A116|nr:hypothetical protein [Ulvibacterium marinum]
MRNLLLITWCVLLGFGLKLSGHSYLELGYVAFGIILFMYYLQSLRKRTHGYSLKKSHNPFKETQL